MTTMQERKRATLSEVLEEVVDMEHTNLDGSYCKAGDQEVLVRDLAYSLGVQRRTATRWVRELEALSLVEVGYHRQAGRPMWVKALRVRGH